MKIPDRTVLRYFREVNRVWHTYILVQLETLSDEFNLRIGVLGK